MTTRTVIALSAKKATSIACQIWFTTPNPAVMSIANAQLTYRTVTALRGRPLRCPITRAASTDPAANTAKPPR